METGTVTIITFVARKKSLTPEQFYKHWREVHGPIVAPWCEKVGIIGYRQLHTAGEMVPVFAMGGAAPNARSAEGKSLPTTPQPYDGIVIWEVPNVETFAKGFEDPYYKEVIEPDEHNLIDKEGFARGVVATFTAPNLQMVGGGKSSITGEGAEGYRKRFDEFEAKQKK